MGSGNQDDRIRDQNREAIAQLISRREQAKLVRVLRRLDPPGVDNDVLGRGRERYQQGEGPEQSEPALRTDQRHRNQAETNQDLGQHHPATAAPESAEDRRVYAVDDRRPQRLERVRETYPG